MNPDPSFPNVTVSFPLSRRERNTILRAFDHCEQEILDLINRFAPAEPLTLSVKELDWLANMLAAKADQLSGRSTRPLMKIVERLDAVVGEECGLRPRPGEESQFNQMKHVVVDLEVLRGLQLLVETYPELRPRPKGPVQLVPDFKIPAAAKRAMRKAPRPPT